MSKLALMFVALFFVAGSPLSAASPAPVQNKWIVTQLTGDARVVHPGLQTLSLKINAEIAPGDILVTGQTGRATLVRGADYIVIAPHSELRLPTAPQPNGFTRVVQTLGTMLFKVQHTGIPHFAVDTPMLAAVVKGTTFSVVVDQNRSAVQVIQGVVQVSAADGGMMRMVEGGRTVFINHESPKILYDADKLAPAAEHPSSGAVRVSAASPASADSVAVLTSGLVRAEQGADPAVGTSEASSPVQTAIGSTTNGDAKSGGATTGRLAGPVRTSAALVAAAGAQLASAPGKAHVTVPVVIGAVATTPAVNVSTPNLVPQVVAPAIATPAVAVVNVPTSPVNVPSVTTPAVTLPSVAVASVTTPTVTLPSVSVGSIATPPVAVPTVTPPAVTVPSVTTPAVTLPSVAVASVTTPTVTVPPVSVGSVTTPAATAPGVSTPTVTVPSITTPVVTTPVVTVPKVTTPQVIVSLPKLFGY